METQRDVDVSALVRLRKIGGDDLVHRMLVLFDQYAPARVADALAAGQAYDLGGVARAAHALRSSAGNVGASRLYGVATGLEIAATQGRSPDVFELLSDLEDACRVAREQLPRRVQFAA